MAPTIEFSDGFDAVAWHYERMSRPNYDEYYDQEGGQEAGIFPQVVHNFTLRCYENVMKMSVLPLDK